MKHKAIKLLGLVGVTTTATLMGGAQASAITIDDFSQNQTVTSNTSNTTDVTGTDNSGSGYIGGTRTVTVQGEDPNTIVDINNGAFTFDTDPQDPNPLATLTYDDGGNGLGGIDLTDGGNSNQLTFESLEGQGEITVSIENGSNESDSFTFSNIPDGQDESLSLNNFSDSVVKNADTVELTFDETTGGTTNLTTDQVSTTEPVPFNTQSWIGLAFLGSWGAWKYWQRKRTQQS